MGTTASVLQWSCSNCNLLNPVECNLCFNCRKMRFLLRNSERKLNFVDYENKTSAVFRSLKLTERIWTCLNCTYAYNSMFSEQCNLCHSMKSNINMITKCKINCPGTIPLKNNEQWICDKCTLVNVATKTECAACGGSKLGSVIEIGETIFKRDNFWTCMECTLKNCLEDHICSACTSSINHNDIGDWSDDSPLWCNGLRNILMPHGGSEGVFWISFEDVLKYFDCIDICKVRDCWNEVRLLGNSQPLCALSCVIITVIEPTEAEFTLFQEGQRNSEKSLRSQLDLCVVVFKTRNSTQPEVGRLVEHSKRQVRGFVGCHKMLETDVYLLVCLSFNHWHTGIEDPSMYPQCVLAIHSSKKLIVQQISPPSYLLADVIISLTLTKGQRHEGREGMTAYYLTKGWAGLVVMVENRHENKWIHVKCDCKESYNVVSTRGELQTIDSVPPMQRQVIIVLTQLEGSGGFSIAHRLTHRLANSSGLHDWGPPSSTNCPPIDSIYDLHSPRLIT
ncbi:calpain-D isoform X6 [Malaya genurostris]|uniref:calpain-D isoform X6 n=1 Tax=Malaya genurostris TaxID=325434 RepID=UPI0026F3841F|nr:calpain-D isoform X6 [Malaya genurostris]